ncbi:MAG TPA: Pls/PosA family non-ribosomal peptide synthetase, partial [Pilimelia sp.]|nr:Pls/PosA family non-ribosomal peptide synthetase [Pilimelia sp.]
TDSGHQLLVGYVVPAGEAFTVDAAVATLRTTLPAALVPLIAVVDTLPTRTSGKVDRAALPWPPPGTEPGADAAPLHGTAGWLAGLWRDVLGTPVTGEDDDFFQRGGSSLSAARLVSLARARHPAMSVNDVYQNPVLRTLAQRLELLEHGPVGRRQVTPTPRRAGAIQIVLMLPLLTVAGLRWAVPVAAAGNVLAAVGGYPWAPSVSWWLVAAGWLLLHSPPGRLAIAASGARLLLRGVRPGRYPRGGAVHLRLWTAERLAAAVGAASLTGGWLTHYARALGARIGPEVDLHSPPPVTGMLRVGPGAAVEPEVDLTGHWVDGDQLRLGRVKIGPGARVGARSTLLPGARVGRQAEVAPGSCVAGAVAARQRWSGTPATRTGKARHHLTARAPRARRWAAAYSVTAFVLDLFPPVAVAAGLAVVAGFVSGRDSFGAVTTQAMLAVPAATVVAALTYAFLVLAAVRVLGIGMRPGRHPVHGRVAWQAWATERLMSGARVGLFPLYSSLLTPVWLRALGMKVGRGVEASTVLALPRMTTVGDGAFLADDTMIASYELGGGWLRIAAARVGKRAFLGNSGMTAPGRQVPKHGLVGVLSAAPKRAKAGSSWLGMPPMRLPRAVADVATDRTFHPSRWLRAARAAVELCRLIPMVGTAALAVAVGLALVWLHHRHGVVAALAAAGPLLAAAGVLGCLLALLAKWILMGRFAVAEHPLWSGFVWRNELADAFVELLAVPWLVGSLGGTPLMSLWLRACGARIGRGVWCETHWLPEADLITVGDGATVNRGCVVQTHLFHDRIMRMDTVELAEGATLGPHAIVLPGAAVGAHTTIGPASLVMGGERVPTHTRWFGNPIAPWRRGGARLP